METRTDDPLKRLPYEIWIKCIQFYAHEQPEGALPLIAVSTNWRDHLLGAPEIWATIYLDGGHDERCRVETFFHLSKNLPMELVLDREPGTIENAIKYRGRFKTLVFRTTASTPYSSKDITRLSKQLGNFSYPNLAHIHVEPPCGDVLFIPPYLVEVCPALVGIHGAYIEEATIPYLSPYTTSFSVLGGGMLHKGIGDQLQSLRVCCIPSQSEEGGSPGYFTGPSTNFRSFILLYGVDKAIGTSEFGPENRSRYLIPIQGFSSAVHHGLRTLKVTIPWCDLSRLTPCISACTGLREVELLLDCTIPGLWDVSPLTRLDFGHVKQLTVSAIPRRSADIRDSVTRIMHMFAKGDALENLEELRLKLRDTQISQIVELLRATKNLKELHLLGFSQVETFMEYEEYEKIRLDQLHTLVVQYESNLRHLDIPRLACLRCSWAGSGFDSSPISPANKLQSMTIPIILLRQGADPAELEKLCVQPYSRLLALHLTSGKFIHSRLLPLDFISLGIISFEEQPKHSEFMRTFPGHSLLNGFLLQLLFGPDVCPRLHTIRANKYPNWALATAVFHRRNALKTVRPIDSFWLHGYPQMNILMVIIKALAVVEENPEHSIDAATGIDRTLRQRWTTLFFRDRACQDCAMSGYIACEASHELNKDSHPPEDPLITELLDLMPMYPSAKWPSIFTRDIWEDHLDKTEIRDLGDSLVRCNRHTDDQEKQVHIGPHMLEGLSYDAH